MLKYRIYFLTVDVTVTHLCFPLFAECSRQLKLSCHGDIREQHLYWNSCYGKPVNVTFSPVVFIYFFHDSICDKLNK